MKIETQSFLVQSKTPPTIEVDSEARAIYVRFRKAKVAKTVPHCTEGMFCSVDLDKSGHVIGIEALGFDGIRLDKVIAAANVSAPNVDFGKATIRATPSTCPV